jgi:hypothetical protein
MHWGQTSNGDNIQRQARIGDKKIQRQASIGDDTEAPKYGGSMGTILSGARTGSYKGLFPNRSWQTHSAQQRALHAHACCQQAQTHTPHIGTAPARPTMLAPNTCAHVVVAVHLPLTLGVSQRTT